MSNDCKKVWERQVEELMEIDDIVSFISEDVLEIERVQQEHTGFGFRKRWETKEYILLTATGGPSVRVSTRGYIEVNWWNESYESSVPDEVKAILGEIESYLKEIDACL